jgi:hypothetical protein
MDGSDPIRPQHAKLPPIPYAEPAAPWLPPYQRSFGPPMVIPVSAASFMPRRNGLAVASLVCGIAALVLIWIPYVGLAGVLAAVVAIVFGGVGIWQAGRRHGQGKGMAVAGLVLGCVCIVIVIGVVIFVMIMIQQMMSALN